MTLAVSRVMCQHLPNDAIVGNRHPFCLGFLEVLPSKSKVVATLGGAVRQVSNINEMTDRNPGKAREGVIEIELCDILLAANGPRQLIEHYLSTCPFARWIDVVGKLV